MMTFVFCSKSGAKDAKSQLRHSLFAQHDRKTGLPENDFTPIEFNESFLY